jgi:hypothetical protein
MPPRRRRNASQTVFIPRAAPSPVVYPLKELLMRPYAQPTSTDMAVIIVYYNYVNSLRILQNLLFVKQKLESANIPLFIAEIAYDGMPFSFPDSPNIFHFRTNSYLFYKENGAAIVTQQLPDTYTKICLMDGDICFDDPAWYNRLSKQLDTYDLCQGFSNAVFLDVTLAKIIKEKIHFADGDGHSGFVWAYKRAYAHQLLPEFALVGSGDTTLATCSNPNLIYQYSYGSDVDAYKKQIPYQLKRSYVQDCTAYHLYHGSLDNRQYKDRHTYLLTALQSHGLHKLSDVLQRGPSGLYEFKSEYHDEFNGIMIAYFQNRNDDSI